MSTTHHKVELDICSNGQPRYTCRSESCAEATLTKQSYMSAKQWDAATETFLAQHKCRKIISKLPKEHLVAQH